MLHADSLGLVIGERRERLGNVTEARCVRASAAPLPIPESSSRELSPLSALPAARRQLDPLTAKIASSRSEVSL